MTRSRRQPGADPIWERLDVRPPAAAAVPEPEQVQGIDHVVDGYRPRAYGPRLLFREGIPLAELEPLEPRLGLAGGLRALYDGRGRNRTPLWLPEQPPPVFADALTAPHGELRVWDTPWLRERALPAMSALLDLPFVTTIASHCEPLHDPGGVRVGARAASQAGVRDLATPQVVALRPGSGPPRPARCAGV